MAAKEKKPGGDQPQITEIMKIEKRYLDVHILGISPLIYNRPSEKTRRELLAPAGRKSAVDKATSLKHDPLREYRDSVYKYRDETAPTLLYFVSSAFKGAAMTAALDLPGAKKAQVGRLVWVEGDKVPIYGVPQLRMDIVRSADMARTPDVRTRAILPAWAAKFTLSFITQLIGPQAVANLLAGGGLTAGIGDYRCEKGKGNFGAFEIVGPDDPRYLEVIATGGRAEQLAALENPSCYDDETESLYSWFDEEMERRSKSGTKATTRAKHGKAEEVAVA